MPFVSTIKELQQHVGETPFQSSPKMAVALMHEGYEEFVNAITSGRRDDIGSRATEIIMSSFYLANCFQIDLTETVNRVGKIIDEKTDRIETVGELQCMVDGIYDILGKRNKDSIDPKHVIDNFLNEHMSLKQAIELRDTGIIANSIVSVVMSMTALASMYGIDLEQVINEKIQTPRDIMNV